MAAGGKFDFFLSRRGSVAATAQEVADILTSSGYAVMVQDYDIPLTANFIEAMHEAVKNARDLVILFTSDYETSPYTRKEFTSFEADRAQSAEERRVVILRCEDTPLRGLFAPNVYQDLVGIDDPAERRRRVLAAIEGHSQAPRPPPLPFVGIPPRIANFTGREPELDHLDAILMRNTPAAITQTTGRAALHGMGGVGKTSLAIEYAYRYRRLYAGIWWCPAEARTGLLTALAALAVHLGAISPDEPDLEKSAKAALRRLAEQRATFLLIYDNVTDPESIADLLPSAGARVLITSRFPDWTSWAEEVSLDVLPPEEAAAFLQHRASRPDPAGAALLAEALGRLPLALDHAAAYCKRTQTTFPAYATKLESLIVTLPRGTLYPRSVAATFNLAITAAVAQCPAADPMMAFLAHCAPERIPLLLAEGALPDEGQRTEALLALTELSLLRPDPFEDATPAVTVHRLVQAVARARAPATGNADTAANAVLQRLAAIYPTDAFSDPASWPLCEQLTQHLLTRCNPGGAIEPATAAQASLLNRAASFFHGRAAYLRASPLFRRSVAIREMTLGCNHPDTAASLNNLALLLRAQGDLAGARPLFERALAIREKALGADHPDTATNLNNLALLLQARGDLARARPLFERALAIREQALGADHPDTAASLNNLAGLLQAQGDLAGARPLLERALAIYEKALGADHPDTATSFNNLAGLLQAQGDLEGARPLFERALANREKALGADHPDTGISLNNLAGLLRDQGDLVGARPLFERALGITEKALGSDHPDTAIRLSNLGRLLQDQGDLGEARTLFERALAICEEAHGPDHPLSARIRSHYARLLLADGNRAAAMTAAETALAAHAKELGPKAPWTTDSARVAADALVTLGRTQEANTLRTLYGIP